MKLILKLFAINALTTFASAGRIPALNHESLHVAMEPSAVVGATGTKGEKILQWVKNSRTCVQRQS